MTGGNDHGGMKRRGGEESEMKTKYEIRSTDRLLKDSDIWAEIGMDKSACPHPATGGLAW